MNRLAARHEILRTTFEEGDSGPLQVVHPPGEAPLTVHDLTAAANPTAEMRNLIAKYASQSFDLQRGPLLRFALFKTSANEHRLLRVIHHIIYDSSSWKFYMEELAELYAAAATRAGAAKAGRSKAAICRLCMLAARILSRRRAGMREYDLVVEEGARSPP